MPKQAEHEDKQEETQAPNFGKLHTKGWSDGEPLPSPRVLVVRYREATPNGLSTHYLYVGGPISDPHKLNIAKITARMHAYAGEKVYMEPEALEKELEREMQRKPELRATGGWSPIPGTPGNDDGEEQRRYEEEAAKHTGDKW